MNFRGLEVFVAVIDEGTFAGASSIRGLSRPAVTERVAAFEREVGFPLFERVCSIGTVLTLLAISLFVGSRPRYAPPRESS